MDDSTMGLYDKQETDAEGLTCNSFCENRYFNLMNVIQETICN